MLLGAGGWIRREWGQLCWSFSDWGAGVQAFVFVACPADIMRLLGLGAGWRGWAVGCGLASVREMALVAAMFAIGVAACDRGGRVLHGRGGAYRCFIWDLSSCSEYRIVFSIVGSRCEGFSL